MVGWCHIFIRAVWGHLDATGGFSQNIPALELPLLVKGIMGDQ